MLNQMDPIERAQFRVEAPGRQKARLAAVTRRRMQILNRVTPAAPQGRSRAPSARLTPRYGVSGKAVSETGALGTGGADKQRPEAPILEPANGGGDECCQRPGGWCPPSCPSCHPSGQDNGGGNGGAGGAVITCLDAVQTGANCDLCCPADYDACLDCCSTRVNDCIETCDIFLDDRDEYLDCVLQLCKPLWKPCRRECNRPRS